MNKTAAWLALLGALALPVATVAEGPDLPNPASQICSGAPGQGGPADSNAPPVMIPGFGSTGYQADTGNALARAWFAQGVRLFWSFDETEAIRAFEYAQKLDPNCAMCAWGEAWARGPTINYAVDEAGRVKALAAADRAEKLSGKLGERDKGLIAAMRARYLPGPNHARDAAFAIAMLAMADRYPDDNDVLLLASDAQLINTTADVLDNPRLMAMLETVLARDPNHSFAIHLYIHATEWAGDPGKAELYANRLAALTPGASHLIHMPSHTFYNIGRYEDAAIANVEAVKADIRYAELGNPPGGATRSPLHRHNIQFGLGGALMAGDAPSGLFLADHMIKAYDDTGDGWSAFSRAHAWYAYGQLADPDRVLAMPGPVASAAYLRVAWRYARGEAMFRKRDVAGLKAELAALRREQRAVPASKNANIAKTYSALVRIPSLVLEGRLAVLQNRPATAANAFGKAAKLQDGAWMGQDPPLWWYPIRRSLAAAYLRQGDLPKARAAVDAALKLRPKDPTSLFVRSQVEAKAGDSAAAAKDLEAASATWMGAGFSLDAA
jgi:tetratricopeptide (TPR) repeat protein